MGYHWISRYTMYCVQFEACILATVFLCLLTSLFIAFVKECVNVCIQQVKAVLRRLKLIEGTLDIIDENKRRGKKSASERGQGKQKKQKKRARPYHRDDMVMN